MKVYDVSMTISHDIQVYKNKEDKKPVFETTSNFNQQNVYETKMCMNLHTGTHMDFPLHMVRGGKTSDTLDLSKLIRKVKVFDLTHVKEEITAGDLEPLDIQVDDFVLFKTKNSYEETFNFKFVYLRKDSAAYLAAKKVAGVGIDALGIERDQENHPTHHILMDQEIMIIEGLRLEAVEEKTYMMYALPIKIKAVEALPLSVILVEESYD
ncbi:MAG: cyclase family protein [Acholeplasmataceae bacterium]|jgi:arylformamidase|nr:cyclase family protein [Acholeplasmataceae bacterium]